MAKKEETEEESPASGEEAAEAEELTADEASSMIIDAEVLIRAGAEKIDALVTAGALDAKVRDNVDAVWNALLAKIEEEEN